MMRIPGIHKLWLRFPLGSVPVRVRYGVWDRAHYAYGVYGAAILARQLGLDAITAIEFGVAGGNGLIALERTAAIIGSHLGINIAVYGFDTGKGMPRPLDYRDLPHVWSQGFYRMDQEALQRRLAAAKLVLGDVEETLRSFTPSSPIGFVAFDLDYYSSTKGALRVLERDHLPRVYCYFDDTIWPELACHNEYTGELCAIREFNSEHTDQKICLIHGLKHTQPRKSSWHDALYVFHDFRHSLYCVNVSKDLGELPLVSRA